MAHTAEALEGFRSAIGGLPAGSSAVDRISDLLGRLELDIDHPAKRTKAGRNSALNLPGPSSAVSDVGDSLEGAPQGGDKSSSLQLLIGSRYFSLPRSLFSGNGSLLETRESFFGLLASGRIPSETDSSTGAFIIHRSPSHFAAIAQYLASGSVPPRYSWKARHHARVVASENSIPYSAQALDAGSAVGYAGKGLSSLETGLSGATPAEIDELAADADFYLLPGLAAQIRSGESLRKAQLGPANWQMRVEENAARATLFAQFQDGGAISDPYLHLINIYSDAVTTGTFTFVLDALRPAPVPGSPPAKFADKLWGQVPTILADHRHVPLSSDVVDKPTSAIVSTLDAFRREFFGVLCPALAPTDLNAEGSLDLDWTGKIDNTGIALFAAGGSVLGALLSSSGDAFASSDVDLFMIDTLGRSSVAVRETALAKIQLIEDAIMRYVNGRKGLATRGSGYARKAESSARNSLVVMRTSRTVTFVVGHPQRHVQVILRIYRSPAEVLLGFDLDCVACGFDGRSVYCLPRARRAITHRINVADPTRQTFRTNSYEYRLWKYSKRGFAIAIPGFDRELVHAGMYLKQFGELTGLGRLLFLEERDYYKQFVVHNFPPWHEEHPETGISRRVAAMYDDARHTSILDSLNGMNMRVHDYNRGSVLPFSKFVTVNSTRNRLERRIGRILAGCTPNTVRKIAREKLGGPRNLPHLFFVYADSFQAVIQRDACARAMLEHAHDCYGFEGLAPGDSDSDDELPTDEASALTHADNNQLSVNVDAAEVASAFNDGFIWHLPQTVHFIGSLVEYAATLPMVEDDWFADAYGVHQLL